MRRMAGLCPNRLMLRQTHFGKTGGFRTFAAMSMNGRFAKFWVQDGLPFHSDLQTQKHHCQWHW